MSETVSTILLEDWSDYEVRKARFTKSLKSFDPYSGWEITYLVNKIKSHHPEVDPNAIRIAIYSFSQASQGPYWREHLVEWVLKRIGL